MPLPDPAAARQANAFAAAVRHPDLTARVVDAVGDVLRALNGPGVRLALSVLGRWGVRLQATLERLQAAHLALTDAYLRDPAVRDGRAA